MSKIQPIKFKNLGELFDFLHTDELNMVEHLRDIIFEKLPDCKEKLAYNVPFYYRYPRICFIWPAAVPWGGVDSGVAIGFCRGHLLSDEIGNLEKQIESDLLRSYFLEAKLIDEHS